MTTPLQEILRQGGDLLRQAGLSRPIWRAEQLLAHHVGCSPIELYLEPLPIPPAQGVRFRADVSAHANGMPLQYLLGSASFYGREFVVGPGAFIPRPETEILIDVALNFLTQDRTHSPGLDPVVVDVGTGSGAIAITLALERPHLHIQAIDCSPNALCCALRNARRHQCSIEFFKGDLVQSVPEGSVDFMVANLPYLDPTTVSSWPRELFWEPWIAFDGGGRGLSLIQRLIEQASSALRVGGKVLLEIGMDQLDSISDFAQRASFQVEQVVPDLAGIDRVVVLGRLDHEGDSSSWKN